MRNGRIRIDHRINPVLALLLCMLLAALLLPALQAPAQAAQFFRFDIYGAVSHGSGLVLPSHQKVWRYQDATIYDEPAKGYFLGAIIDNNDVMPIASPYVIHRVTAEHYVQFYFYRG
jgi:hypothetical protein